MLALRTNKPFDKPGWWSPEQCAAYFAGESTQALRLRLIELIYSPPEDTGAPRGLAREWHCAGQSQPCPLCEQWINWGDEMVALSKELRRRGRYGE